MATALELAIPEPSLVILVGASGSGKSTFARRHFRPTEVVSSDACRAMVVDDENDQSANAAAFAILHLIVAKRLAARRLTVVDATNVRGPARARLRAIARDNDLPAIAIVFDLPDQVLLDRWAARTDRRMGADVLAQQRDQLRRSADGLRSGAFAAVHVLRSVGQVDAAAIRRDSLPVDLRVRSGPFDVIGDVHGCRSELAALLGRLGWILERDAAGRATGGRHPGGRTAVFLGDLVDRGPDTPGVLRLAMGMVAAGAALCVEGNHEHKLGRAMAGDGPVSAGRARSLEQLGREPAEFRTQVRAFLAGLDSHYLLAGGRLVVAHAGLPQRYHGRLSDRVRDFARYGKRIGTDEHGLPVRYSWAQDYAGEAMVVYGHTPVGDTRWVNNTLCIDTGCVFGGRLTALRYPEQEIVSVPAERVWFAARRPFPPGEETPQAGTSRPAGT